MSKLKEAQFPTIALAVIAWALFFGLAISAGHGNVRTFTFLVAAAIYFGSLIYIIILKARSSELAWGNLGFAIAAQVFVPMIPFLPHAILLWGSALRRRVLRGNQLVDAKQLQRELTRRQNRIADPRYPLFEVGGVSLPNDLENLGFFMVGSPGSGKTQAIKRMLSLLRDRPDYRVMILDRNGELTENFFDKNRDLIFNPQDARTVGWSHENEDTEPETLAAALIPDSASDENQFFTEAARSLMADLFERCDRNSAIWKALSQTSHDELKDLVKGGLSARIFGGGRMTASVLSTMVNGLRFYKELGDSTGRFSFRNWGREDDPSWLFLPIFEDSAEKYKPLCSAAFELVLRGMLSNERRGLKTAIVIDELGALNQLKSLPRLLAEGRKFGGTAILGTQAAAQIRKTYGQDNLEILLQSTASKLILNCRDYATAELFANQIGKVERIDITRSEGRSGMSLNSSRSEQIRETHIVLPNQLQSLPNMQGYLSIADGTAPAMVELSYRAYPEVSARLAKRH